jgi:hypothetical protein
MKEEISHRFTGKMEEGLLMRKSNVRWMLVAGIWAVVVMAVALATFQVMSG